MNRLLLLFFLLCLAAHALAQSDSANLVLKECVRLGEKNNLDSALYYANVLETLTKREAGEISERQAMVLHLIAEIYRMKENYKAAAVFFQSSTHVFTQIAPHIANWEVYALSAARTGFMLDKLGATEQATGYFSKAIQLNNQRAKPSDNLQIHLRFATLMVDKGEYAQADSLYAQMQEVLDTLPKDGSVYYLQASLYNNIAILYSETGNLSKGVQLLQQALVMEDLSKKEGYKENDYVEVSLNLAEAFALTGRMDSAWEKCRQAEKNIPQSNRLYLNAQLVKVKAVLYQQQEDYDGAIDLYKRYLRTMKNFILKPGNYYALLVNLGILYNKTKQFEQADSLFRQSIRQLRQERIGYSFILQQSLAGLSASLINRKKYGEATDSLLVLIRMTFAAMNKNFASMSESDKLKYRSALDTYFDLLYTCLYAENLHDDKKVNEIFLLELQRKNLVLTSQVQLLRRIRDLQDTASANLISSWLNNRQVLSRQYSLPVYQRLFNTDSLENSNQLFEKKIAAKGYQSLFESNTLVPANFLERQAPRSAMIEFVRFSSTPDKGGNEQYAVFIYKKGDTVPVFEQLCSEAELLHLMQDDKGKPSGNEQLAQSLYSVNGQKSLSLYRLIWQPLTAHLSGIDIINYSPAGMLNNIAFQAISPGRKRLLDTYVFHRFSSLLDAGDTNAHAEPPRAVSLWGNMDYNKASYRADSINTSYASSGSSRRRQSADLLSPEQTKGAAKTPFKSFQTEEIDGLKELFARHRIGISDFERDRATEEKFKQAAGEVKDVLHVSTHGFYFPLNKTQTTASSTGDFISTSVNPLLRCGLTFSGANHYWIKGVPMGNHDDGILTGFEVAQLDLHKVRLVTLSACETGLGEVTGNEGDLGLQRAFRLAGVRYLLVSLWQVPAKQTAELLISFYTNWLKGLSLSESLHKAASAMEQKGYPPYFWAGFVLIE